MEILNCEQRIFKCFIAFESAGCLLKCQCLYCSAAVVYHRQKAEGEGERWKEGEREQERERWLSFSLQIVSYSTVNDARHYSPLFTFSRQCVCFTGSAGGSHQPLFACVFMCVCFTAMVGVSHFKRSSHQVRSDASPPPFLRLAVS